ncbi:MAG: hypothetical protein PHF83_05450, partial [Candidatus Methanomethylophilus sp.]|nr:hypothetical protein [Methanomethylophilus sp.]
MLLVADIEQLDSDGIAADQAQAAGGHGDADIGLAVMIDTDAPACTAGLAVRGQSEIDGPAAI